MLRVWQAGDCCICQGPRVTICLAKRLLMRPLLQVVPVETLVRDALAATTAPLQRSPGAAAGGLPAARLLCGALQQALQLVYQAAE